MTALLVFALPFALYGLAYGSYCLGRSLARLVPILWAKFRQKRKDRPERAFIFFRCASGFRFKSISLDFRTISVSRRSASRWRSSSSASPELRRVSSLLMVWTTFQQME